METVEVSFDQVFNLAQRLSLVDQVKLIARLGPAMEQALDKAELPEKPPRPYLYGALAVLGPAPSSEDIDEIRREMWRNCLDDRVFAQTVAPIQEAWKNSGLSEDDLPEILRQVRAEVFRQTYGHLFTEEQYALLPLDDELVDFLLERNPKFIEECQQIRQRMMSGESYSQDEVERLLAESAAEIH